MGKEFLGSHLLSPHSFRNPSILSSRGKLLAALGIAEWSLCEMVFRPWTSAWFSNSVYSVRREVPLLTLASLFHLRLRLQSFGPAPSPLPPQQESVLPTRRGLLKSWRSGVHSRFHFNYSQGAVVRYLPLRLPRYLTFPLNKTCSPPTTEKGLRSWHVFTLSGVLGPTLLERKPPVRY